MREQERGGIIINKGKRNDECQQKLDESAEYGKRIRDKVLQLEEQRKQKPRSHPHERSRADQRHEAGLNQRSADNGQHEVQNA